MQLFLDTANISHIKQGAESGLITGVTTNPTLIMKEGKDYVIFRHSGDPSVAGTAGALLFGVHYFKKDQLHTFEVIE